MQKFFCLFILLLAGALSAAGTAPRLNEFGALELDGTSWLVTFVNKSWTAFSYDGRWRDAVFHRREGGTDSAAFRVTIPDFPAGELKLALTPEGESFRYRADVSFTEPAELASLSLETRLPVKEYAGNTLKIDGKPFMLPREEQKGLIVHRRAAMLEIPARNGWISLRGDFELHIQDNRAYKLPSYTVRIRLTPGFGRITAASLALTVRCGEGKGIPLDLRRVVNAGFADDVAGDGKGGWTDQGPENDLRMLTPGRQVMKGITFDVIDPAKNGGRSCIMLAGKARPKFPDAAACEVPENVSGTTLYLLHAIAWPGPQVGSVKVTYRDGSADTFEVRGGREVGNWWGPAQYPNGEVVWTAENAVAYVGLFRSRFALRPLPVARVEFRSAKEAVWGIVGATVSDWEAPRSEVAPYFIIAGDEWREIPFYKEIEKGSILDFSDTLDAPAGKSGPLVRRGDKLVFRDRPETPVRFYGTNISGTSFYLDKAQADRFADRMAACGFNQIRIHHHDEPLTDTVWRMTLAGDTQWIAAPGQFVNIALEGRYLRRPISVCDFDDRSITLIYKVVGGGTEQMSRMQAGEELDLLTGLGNGFSTKNDARRPLLVGGGVGVPPLYNLAKRLLAEGKPVQVVLGFNTAAEVFYEEEFRALGCEVTVSTVDGSRGVEGFVTTAIAERGLDFDYFYACGPLPMLHALYNATDRDGQLSFEERMGCGFGACMGCSCKTKYGNKRICKEGPVLEKGEIIW